MVGYFNTPLLATGRSNEKISKEDMNNSINITQSIFLDYSTEQNLNTYFRVHGIVTKTDCMLVHEIKLEKFVVQSLNRVQLFATSWTPAGKAQTHIHGIGDVILPFHHEKFKITEIMTVLMIHSPQMN